MLVMKMMRSDKELDKNNLKKKPRRNRRTDRRLNSILKVSGPIQDH